EMLKQNCETSTNQDNFVYRSKGIAYKTPEEKKLIRKNFYTYWDEITFEEWDEINRKIDLAKSKGSNGDKRTIKVINNKYYKRYYVTPNYNFGDKGFYSLKKTQLTLGSVGKTKLIQQPKGLTTLQLNEATEKSKVPSSLIQEIFKKFK
ncbi:MAG: hypothetical protein ACRC4M_03265, partial [Mycoplasma sp.]